MSNCRKDYETRVNNAYRQDKVNRIAASRGAGLGVAPKVGVPGTVLDRSRGYAGYGGYAGRGGYAGPYYGGYNGYRGYAGPYYGGYNGYHGAAPYYRGVY